MQIKKIDVVDKKLLVVGPLFDKMDKLHILENMYSEDKILVFLGDICYPYSQFNEVPARINAVRLFMENKDCHYVLGDKDLVFMNKTFSTHRDSHDWLSVQPTGVKFLFKNNTSALVIHGGILPKHTTWGELNSDLEISFITNVPEINKSWHKVYNGRFGYVISSHPNNKKNEVEINKHSISLDTSAYETNKVAVQEFSDKGLGQTFYI